MRQITKANLEAVLGWINHATGNKEEAWTKQEDGTFKCNVGTYVLDWANGGVRLSQLTSDGGGERDITGRATKRETYHRMHAFLSGLQRDAELLAALAEVVKDANLKPGETKACSIRMSTVRRAIEAIAKANSGEGGE